jgi:hypothetical protein
MYLYMLLKQKQLIFVTRVVSIYYQTLFYYHEGSQMRACVRACVCVMYVREYMYRVGIALSTHRTRLITRSGAFLNGFIVYTKYVIFLKVCINDQ